MLVHLAMGRSLTFGLPAHSLEGLRLIHADGPAYLLYEPAQLTQAIESQIGETELLLAIPQGTRFDPADLGQAVNQAILRCTSF